MVQDRAESLLTRLAENQHFVVGSMDIADYETDGIEVSELSGRTVEFCIFEPNGGYFFQYDYSNNKVKAYYFDYDAGADGAAIEVGDTVSINLTGIKFIAICKEVLH